MVVRRVVSWGISEFVILLGRHFRPLLPLSLRGHPPLKRILDHMDLLRCFMPLHHPLHQSKYSIDFSCHASCFSDFSYNLAEVSQR